jgi:DNA-binding MarR family transcriptional regulator
MTDLATQSEPRTGPRLMYLVKRLEMAERARMEEVLRPHGVTLHQYTALSILERRQGLSSAQLARRHFVTPQAMNQMVATMERDGLIERRPDEVNRKILRAWLTEHGARVLRKCHELVDELETRMLTGLTARQAGELQRSLERCLAALSELRD